MRTFTGLALSAVLLLGLAPAHAADATRDAATIERLGGETDQLRKQLGLVQSRLATAEESVVSLTSRLAKVDDASRTEMGQFRESVDAQLEAGLKRSVTTADLEALGQKIATLADAVAKLQTATEDSQRATQANREGLSDINQQLATVVTSVTELRASTSDVPSQLASVRELAQGASEAAKATTTRMGEIESTVAETKTSVAALPSQITSVRELAQGASEAAKATTKSLAQVEASAEAIKADNAAIAKRIDDNVEAAVSKKIAVAARRAINDMVAAGDLDIAPPSAPVKTGARPSTPDASVLSRLTKDAPVPDDAAVNRAPYDVVLVFGDEATATRMSKFLTANGLSPTPQVLADGSNALMVGRFYEYTGAVTFQNDVSKRFGLKPSIMDREGTLF
ncbi:hypothetical protein [Sinimarinibacterium sp. CAU 1509]|uniref:hypothetical protein n=1 Tax=Sinimarinibacterium sp. CAU 1509 TaxID=2562283 RepID=UPI00146D54BF|nr:hypothetical protein [Sinimarinibacterium sp. CAU 1509]